MQVITFKILKFKKILNLYKKMNQKLKNCDLYNQCFKKKFSIKNN